MEEQYQSQTQQLQLQTRRRQQTESQVTLSDVNAVGRNIVKFSIIGMVAFIVLRMMLTSFVAYWKATHPEPPPAPSMGFGKLTQIDFPLEIIRPDELQLELPNNTLPSFGDRAKVFFMPFSSPSLLADEQAKSKAAKYGFTSQPQIVDNYQYRWFKKEPLDMTLEMDIRNFNFTLESDYLAQTELLLGSQLPDDYSAVQMVKSFLSRSNSLPADVATNSGQITYLKSLGGELLEAVSLSDADLIQVDLDRYPIDDQYEFYTPKGDEGIISALVTGAYGKDVSVVEMRNSYQHLDYSQIETYPLWSVKEAWEALKDGDGYVAQGQELETAIIREITLGYYDEFAEQQYMQPIFVFRGDDDFLAFIPALDPSVFAKD